MIDCIHSTVIIEWPVGKMKMLSKKIILKSKFKIYIYTFYILLFYNNIDIIYIYTQTLVCVYPTYAVDAFRT